MHELDNELSGMLLNNSTSDETVMQHSRHCITQYRSCTLFIIVVIFCIDAAIAASDQKTNSLIKIDEAIASSTANVTVNGGTDYSATNALRRGARMWCSEDSSKLTESVLWTGTLRIPRLAKGVRIHWGYSPGRFKIDTSYDGNIFYSAIDWTTHTRKEEEFSEDIFFPQQLKVGVIQIAMEQPRHGYFGINFVALISDGHSLLQLASGITSEESEMCLQVESGKTIIGTSIVLEPCYTAIAAGDGRDIFRFNENNQIIHELSQLCVSLKNNDVAKGGDIVLSDCKLVTASKGQSQWEVLSDNRLKLLRAGDWCLSQEGFKAGSADLGIQKMTKSNYPRALDTAHSADKAVDGDYNTFWVSQDFDYPDGLPDEVDFSLDLGGDYKLQYAEIQWIYPAARYQVSLSLDGKNYTTISTTIANSMNISRNALEGNIARYVKLELQEPHPILSIHNQKAIYGIIRFSLFANRLKSIVQNCEIARKSKDARDKYFAVFVSEFDYETGYMLSRKDKNFVQSTVHLETVSNNLASLSEPMNTCYSELKSYQQQLTSSIRRLGLLKEQFRLANDGFEHILQEKSTSDNLMSLSDLPIGNETPENILPNNDSFPEDCTDILLSNLTSITGFYTIQPSCSTTPLRVYCNFETQQAVYVYHGDPPSNPGSILTRDLFAPEEVSKRCLKLDMVPLVLKHQDDAIHIQTMLRHMKFNSPDSEDLVFPLATITENQFRALDMQTDMSHIFSGVLQPDTQQKNAFGLSWLNPPFVYFDWENSEIGGALCTTHPSIWDIRQAVNVECYEIARNNPKFQGCPFTSILARCPLNCASENGNKALPLYGDNTYRDDSAVCIAAMHSDGLGKHNVVNVTFMPGMGSYESVRRNGIRSLSYNGAVWDRSFRVSKPVRTCNNVTTKTSKSPSFLQMSGSNSDKLQSYKSSDPSVSITPITSAIPQRSPELDGLTMSTEAIVSRVIAITEYTGGASPELTRLVAEKTGEKLSASRSILKPSEKLKEKLKIQTTALEKETVALSKKIFSFEDDVLSYLTTENNKLQSAKRKKQLLWGFRNITLPSVETLLSHHFWNFFTELNLVTSLAIEPHPIINNHHKKSAWFMSTNIPALLGRRSIAALSYVDYNEASCNTSANSFIGSGLTIQDKWVYDGVFTLDYYIEKGSGSFGLVFRVRDSSNMYLYEVQQSTGVKRLVKFVNGDPIELGSKQDGGFLTSVWYSLKIQLKMNEIMITSGKNENDATIIFHIEDSSFIGGSIGVFAHGVHMYIDGFKFIASECQDHTEIPAPPYPPACSFYRHVEINDFHNQWYVIDGPKTEIQGVWNFKRDVGGRSNVIVQYAAVTGSEQQYGSIAILKRHRFCSAGIFSVDFFPQCNGIIGLVFHYSNPQRFAIAEVGIDMVRIRVMKEHGEMLQLGYKQQIDDSNSGYTIGEWNSLKVEFSAYSVAVTLNGNSILDQLFNNNTFVAYDDGRVGISTWNCGGVAFHSIRLQPSTIISSSNPDMNSLSFSTTTQYLSKTIENPLDLHLLFYKTKNECRSIHVVDRKNECRSYMNLTNTTPDDSARIWDKETFKTIDLALLPCEYNYCNRCCNHMARNIFTKLNSTTSVLLIPSPLSTFQYSLFREQLISVFNNCLLNCTKNNQKAYQSLYYLQSIISMCTSQHDVIELASELSVSRPDRTSINVPQKLIRSSRSPKRLANDIHEQRSITDDTAVPFNSCLKCCHSNSNKDNKIANECKIHCAVLHNQDFRFWELHQEAIELYSF